jgi:hypothetical protein
MSSLKQVVTTFISVCCTSLARDWPDLTGINLYAKNSNAVYCAIIFPNHTETTTFIKYEYENILGYASCSAWNLTFIHILKKSKLNLRIFWLWLKPNSLQTNQYKAERLTPYSLQTHTATDLTTGVTIASFSLSLPEWPPSESNFNWRCEPSGIKSSVVSHEWPTGPIRRDGQWLLC